MIFRPSSISLFRPITFGALVVFVLTAGIRGCMSASAQGQLNDTLTVVKQERSDVNAKVAQLEAARQKHLPMYLKDISLDGATKEMGDIEALCSKAQQADSPETKAALAAEAGDRAGKLKNSFTDFTNYLQELDYALANYNTAAVSFQKRCSSVRADVARLIQSGYFKQHFSEAYRTLDASDQLCTTVSALLAKKVDRDLPDYLGVYRTSNQGLEQVSHASDMAAAIPALREETARQLESISTDLATAQTKYGVAYTAANQLEQYPRYRRLASVQRKNEELSRVSSLVTEAQRCNGMDVQDFSGGARAVGEGKRLIEEACTCFDGAVDTLDRIRSAITSIPSARSRAQSAISRAQDEIDSYSQNDQSDAKSTLSSARSSLRTGASYIDSDPPASLSAFEDAQRQADSAYDEVDTADHSYHPSDDDDDYSSSSGGSSGGSSSHGGGTSTYHSGGSSSHYSGGYSSPSRSYGSGGMGSSGPSSSGRSFGSGGLGKR